MNEKNPILETLVDTQKKSIETFVDTTNKFQDAIKSGNPIEKTTEICQDWWNSQVELLNELTSGTKSETEKTIDASQTKMEEYYNSIFENQKDHFKKITDFNLSLLSSASNFGKKSTETTEQFQAIQTNWNSLFESWSNALNSTYSLLNSSLPTHFNQDFFQSIFNTTNMYSKLQDFYKPYFESIKNNNFSLDIIKNFLDPKEYKKITEETFKQFFQANELNSLFASNMKFVQDFFSKQRNSNAQYQEFWNVFTQKFPNLFLGDYSKLTELNSTFSASFKEFYTPMLHLISKDKEKENIELILATFDKSMNYGSELVKIQSLLYSTGQKVAEEIGIHILEKTKLEDFDYSFQNLFNEWVKISEKQYIDLFKTDEFSFVKAVLLKLSLEINKNIEKQFESRIEFLPLVVKSELDELYKTIYDLKKTVKALELKYNTTKTEENTTPTSTTKTSSKKVNA